MKLLLLFFVSFPAYSMKLFVEPGVFVNMSNQAHAEYEGDSGYIRNDGLSYALKFGLHHGHFEYGLESEIYNFVGHFDDDSGSYSLPMRLTYNSVFFGYEFIDHQFLYLAVSNNPMLSMDGKSFREDKSVISLEYSYHIKEWVSFNVKVETNSEMQVDKGNKEELEFGNLMMIGLIQLSAYPRLRGSVFNNLKRGAFRSPYFIAI